MGVAAGYWGAWKTRLGLGFGHLGRVSFPFIAGVARVFFLGRFRTLRSRSDSSSCALGLGGCVRGARWVREGIIVRPVTEFYEPKTSNDKPKTVPLQSSIQLSNGM